MKAFAKNLQYYRKRENMTQEQLAERLEVSRQTVSKWEAGVSYAEMEKILQICDLFSCNMDTLMRGDASESEVADNQRHRRHMDRRRKGITLGTALLVFGVALYEIFSGIGIAEAMVSTLFMAVMIVGILILIVLGMEHDYYKKKYPVIQDFYTIEEREAFEKRFPSRIAAGVGLILIGVLVGMNGEYLPLRPGMKEDFYYGIFLLFVTAAAGILVYTGIGKEEYDIEGYNKENNPDSSAKKKNDRIAAWCGCIMLIATILFLVAGLIFSLWKICWIVYPIGGILCGIATLIINQMKE